MKNTHLKTWTRQPKNLRQQYKLQKLEKKWNNSHNFVNFSCEKT